MGAYNVNGYSYPNQTHSSLSTGYQDELWAASQCRQAIACLERALVAPPLRLSNEAKSAARAVLIMQDRITEWLLLDRKSGNSENYQEALERLNKALTLIEGLEYPSSGVRRKPLGQARDLLQSILVEGLI